MKTLLDKLSQSYKVSSNQSHFVKVADSKAAARYIDDAQLRAKEMTLKQQKVFYNVLKRDITRPEHVLNRDPLDNNFNRMGLLEKRQKTRQTMQNTAASDFSGPLSSAASTYR